MVKRKSLDVGNIDKVEIKSQKKPNRRKNRRPHDIIDNNLDIGLGINMAIGKMDNRALSSHISKRADLYNITPTPLIVSDTHILGW